MQFERSRLVQPGCTWRQLKHISSISYTVSELKQIYNTLKEAYIDLGIPDTVIHHTSNLVISRTNMF